MPRFNQTGFAPLIIVIIIGLLLITTAGSGWYFYSKQSVPQSTDKAPLASVSASLQPDNDNSKIDGCSFDDSDLCKGLINFEKTAHATITQKFGNETQKVIINPAEKRSRIMRYNSKNELISDIITTDKSEYIKDFDTQKWKKIDYTAGDSTTFSTADGNNPLSKFPTSEQVTFQKSTESCGALECFKYQIDSKTGDMGFILWFDNQKYLTQKMVITQNNQTLVESLYDYENTYIPIPEEQDII